MDQVCHKNHKDGDATKHVAQNCNIRLLHSVASSIEQLLGFSEIVIAELLGVNLFDVVGNWHDLILISKIEIVKKMEQEVLVRDVVLHDESVFCPFLQNFLSGDVVDDRIGVQPFDLSVNFFESAFPVGSDR